MRPAAASRTGGDSSDGLNTSADGSAPTILSVTKSAFRWAQGGFSLASPVIGLAGVAVVWSFVDLAWLWARRGHATFLGVDGPFAGDQLQYLSWIRESGEHFFVNNLYDGSTQHALFVHPMFLVSGALWRLGMPLALAFQIWKPITAVALVVAYTAVVRASVDGRAARLAAVSVALFSATPLVLLFAS